MTKAVSRRLLASLFLTLIAVSPLRAAEEQPKAWIVLVGVSEYADKQIKPRPHAEADAQALYDLFTKKEYLGADADHVRLLLGRPDPMRKSQPATRENIVKGLQWLASNARRDDLAVFAFFGQGGPNGERTCYFGSDATFKNRGKTAVAAAEIENFMTKLKSQRFCAFLDVNLKGFDPGQEKIAEANPADVYKIFLGNEEKEDEPAPPGRVVFLATNGLKPSLDLKNHGILTQVVLDGLKGPADKEGYEADGVVTIDELIEYVNTELPKRARKHGKTKEEQEQRHHILPFMAHDGQTNHFTLVKNPKVSELVEKRLARLASLAKEEKITGEIAEEGRKLLGRMPKLRTQQELRKQYQQLVDGKLDVEQFLNDREKVLADRKLDREEAEAFARKVMQAVEIIRESYVKELNRGEMVGWAIRGLYRRLDEKVPAELKERLDQIKTFKRKQLEGLLADVRQELGKREDLAKNKDVDLSMQQMLRHLDPYTNYIDSDRLKPFEIETRGEFTGVGIQVRKEESTDMLIVVTPLKGSPAYRAGIKAGDIILQVTREVDSQGKRLDEPEVLTTRGMPLSEAVSKIQGKAGTRVKLLIKREGAESPLEFDIARGSVEVETVLGVRRKSDDSWDYVIDPASQICYVRLTSFANKTYRELKRVLGDLSKQGVVKGFVLDLRFNPGGLLDSAVKICDLFMDDGLIVTIRPRVGKEQSYGAPYMNLETRFVNFPMVCLVNGGSASGSEIVAACLQDHGRAVVIGERSYGKGSVQNIQPFEPTGAEIKMTTASFWRTSGKNLNRSSTKGGEADEWGVVPNMGYSVKISPKQRDELMEAQRDAEIIHRRDVPPKGTKAEFKDRQLEKALEYLRGQIKIAAGARGNRKAG